MPANVDSTSIDQTYYPTAKLRLVLRFDEFASTDVQKGSPRKPQTVLRGTKSQRNPLTVSRDTSIPGVSRFKLESPSSPSGVAAGVAGPQGQATSTDQRTFSINGIIPKTATWTANGLRAADTLTAKFKYVDCPIDPRTVRACAVEYFLGTVTAEDYRRGIGGEQRTGASSRSDTGEPLNVVPDNYVDPQGLKRTNLRFQGFVDKWEIDWSDDEEPVITIECRDNTQLLIDEEAPPALVISSQKPIDQAIADYLSNFPAFAGLSVEYLPAGATPPTLGGALAGTAYQPQLGPAPARGGAATAKLSVWDYLTDVCGALGHVVVVDGTTIVIEQVKTLFSNKTVRRTDDPFQGRTIDGQDITYRRLVWGRNLGRMKIARNYSRRAATNIEVRCYSTRRKKDLVVRFPDPISQHDKIVAKALPGDGTTDQKWMVYRVRGIEDLATLRTVAENAYQSVGRNELELELETRNLASFGAGNLDPDLLDMKVGDTFELVVARSDDFGTIGQVEQSLATRTQQFMQDLGFDPGLSAAYAKAYSDAGFQTFFRLKAMAIDWDGETDEGGVSLRIQGANYIEVRMDQPVT